jgi:hypothetical protein
MLALDCTYLVSTKQMDYEDVMLILDLKLDIFVSCTSNCAS